MTQQAIKIMIMFFLAASIGAVLGDAIRIAITGVH